MYIFEFVITPSILQFNNNLLLSAVKIPLTYFHSPSLTDTWYSSGLKYLIFTIESKKKKILKYANN